MAQGVAYAARLRGVPATIVVPEHAPQTKIDAIERYGGRVIKVPYEEWWQVLVTGRYEGAGGLFVHPVDNDRVMAGNGTIGLELLEQLDDFDTVVVPYGGGGLVTGIASAVKADAPGRADRRRRAGDGRTGRRDARRGRADRGRVHAVVRRRLGQPRADPARLGAGVASCSTPRSRCRSTRSPPRCA